jgi:MFS family permease
MEAELPATPSQFSLSISLYILFQGTMPLFWSAISEVKGRKASYAYLQFVKAFKYFDDSLSQLVYLGSLSLFTIGSIVVALGRNVKL